MDKLVILDIDRTIYNGSIFLDYSFHLIKKNLVSPKYLSAIGFEFVTYQTGFESYDELVKDCLNYFYEEIKEIKSEILRKELQECLFINHSKFYPFVFELLKKYHHYNFFIISLEPDFIVEEVAKFLKIKNFAGNKFNLDSKMNNLEKPILIFDKLKIFENSQFSKETPFACFGDSESDFPILAKAENKFIINPTSKLQKQIFENKLNIEFLTENTIQNKIKEIF